jgi:ATP-dependent Lon protease
MNDVLRHALVRMPEPIEWEEPTTPVKVPVDEETSAQTAH